LLFPLVLVVLCLAPLVRAADGVYVVQPGDTLWPIAASLGVSPADLARANNLRDSDILYPGQQLAVPGSAAGQAEGGSDDSALASYTVQKGDTISSIARALGVETGVLLETNRLSSDTVIYPGQVLAVPASARLPKPSQPEVSAESIFVFDERSGRALFERDPHRRMAPASVTKIVTAIVALEQADPGDEVVAEFDPAQLDSASSLMGLQPGDVVTLEDLLYGLMLPSGNDAAMAIASYVGGGSVPRFVRMMNDLVARLGLHDTHFSNPHGLDADDHYSSAYDLVMLARYAMQNPEFARIAAAKEWEIRGSRRWTVYNLNKLLWNIPGADGVKVGYTDRAGRTIVGSVSRNSSRLYIGLLKSNDLLADCQALLTYVERAGLWPPAR